MTLAAIACALTGVAVEVAAGKPAEPNALIYAVSGETPVLDRIAAKLFSDSYRVVTLKPAREFVPARLKGGEFYFASYDPRPMREMKTPGKAAIGFVISADGVVRDLRVLESTDPRIADFLINQIQMRRFVPAQYRGAAVASLEYRQAHYDPTNEKDSSMFKDGMGIMGYRDR